MDERTRLFLCVLVTDVCFAVLFGLFGAFTGAVTRAQGRTGGTALGFLVSRAYARLTDRPLSPTGEGALVGGIDGGIFGAAVGLVVGFVAGWNFPAEWLVLRPVLITVTLLLASAVVLGLSAGGLAVIGPRAVLGLFTGGMVGALVGFALAAIDGLFFGSLAGAACGALLVSLWR